MANSEVVAGEAVTSQKLNEITLGADAPNAPANGQLWVDTSATPVLKIWDDGDSLWRTVGYVHVGSSSPSNPVTGHLIYDTDDDTLSVRSPSYGSLAQQRALFVRRDNGTTVNTTNVELTDGSSDFTMIPNIQYRLEFKLKCTCGGPNNNFMGIYFGSAGVETVTLLAGACLEMWSGGIRSTTALSVGGSIEFQDAAGDATTAAATQWIEGWAVFTVNGAGSWNMRFNEVGGGAGAASDPLIDEAIFTLTPLPLGTSLIAT